MERAINRDRRMTDEEKLAEEYYYETYTVTSNFEEEAIRKKTIMSAFLAGLKTGKQEGAEFGYNKANEWHQQVTDNIYDLIAKDWTISYFICIMKDKSLVTAAGSCDEAYNGEVSVNLVFDHNDDKYCMDDIMYWKEIELPEE